MKYFTGLFALSALQTERVLETLCQTVRGGYSLEIVVLADRTFSGIHSTCLFSIEIMSLDAVLLRGNLRH